MRPSSVSLLAVLALAPAIASAQTCKEDEVDERGECPSQRRPAAPRPIAVVTQLEIRATPTTDGAALTIDEVATGHVPRKMPVSAGKHLIKVSRGGYTSSQWVTVTSGQTLVVEPDLEAAPAPPIASGSATGDGKLFARAAELFVAKRYVAAGDAFWSYYQTAPIDDVDRPTALFDAGAALHAGGRYQTSISLLLHFLSRPDRAFVESPHRLEVMRLVAAGHAKLFDLDQAIAMSLDLVEATEVVRKRSRGGADAKVMEQYALNALHNAALWLEETGELKRAAELLVKYVASEPDRRLRDGSLLVLAQIYLRSNDPARAVKTFDSWRAQYGKDEGNEEASIQSYDDVARYYAAHGDARRADEAGALVIKTWKGFGGHPGTRGARLAGHWALRFAEATVESTWIPLEIKTAAKTVDELKKQGARLATARNEAEELYTALDAYGIVEVSMAALVRFGELEQGYGDKLIDVPLPLPIAAQLDRNPELAAIYEQQLQKNVARNRDAAKAAWLQVYTTATKNGIWNGWVARAYADLALEYPSEFRSRHDALVEVTDAP